MENHGELDDLDWQLLTALQENARLSFSELGRQVGLSQPAVAERIRRLEESGVIAGYHAQLNLERVGLPLMAFVRFSTRGRQAEVEALTVIQDLPEVLECHHVAGEDSYIIKAVVSSVRHLEALISRLGSCGQTITTVVLSSPVTHRVISQATLTSATAQSIPALERPATARGSRAARARSRD